MDYDTINEQWEEIILEKASVALLALAHKKFGEPEDDYEWQIMDHWMSLKICAGWMDRKMDELWEMLPQGPQA